MRQHVNLILIPQPFFLTFIEPDIAFNYTLILDRTLKQGFDVLRFKNFNVLWIQRHDVRTIKDSVLIKIVEIIAVEILFIGNPLQRVFFRKNPGIAPFEGIAAKTVVFTVFKDVNTADVEMQTDNFQNMFDAFLKILGVV